MWKEVVDKELKGLHLICINQAPQAQVNWEGCGRSIQHKILVSSVWLLQPS